jgi:hypothetical protein
MWAELLVFLIMVPVAIITWRGIAAVLNSRNPNSSLAAAIQVFVGGGS